MTARPLHVEVLRAAVPMWIDRVGRLTPAELRKRATICGDAIAERGDVLVPSYGQRGETASSFNLLAEGIAVLAHLPGGVEFEGLHWCAAAGHQGVPGRAPCAGTPGPAPDPAASERHAPEAAEAPADATAAAGSTTSLPEQLQLFGAAS